MRAPIYVVDRHGIHDFDSHSLTKCLRHIGLQVHGQAFGAMNVTVKQAMDQGFSIRAC